MLGAAPLHGGVDSCPSNVNTDAALLAAHLTDDNDAFRVLIDRYAPGVLSFLRSFVNDSAMADDLCQDTFLQVHRAAGSFDASRPFKPWVYTVAANKAKDYLRAQGRRPDARALSLHSSSDDSVGPQIEAPTAAADSADPDDNAESLAHDCGLGPLAPKFTTRWGRYGLRTLVRHLSRCGETNAGCEDCQKYRKEFGYSENDLGRLGEFVRGNLGTIKRLLCGPQVQRPGNGGGSPE